MEKIQFFDSGGEWKSKILLNFIFQFPRNICKIIAANLDR